MVYDMTQKIQSARIETFVKTVKPHQGTQSYFTKLFLPVDINRSEKKVLHLGNVDRCPIELSKVKSSLA